MSLLLRRLLTPKKIDILTKTQNRVGLTVVNVSAVQNTLQVHENVVQNYFAIVIPSSVATLKVVIEEFKNKQNL